MALILLLLIFEAVSSEDCIIPQIPNGRVSIATTSPSSSSDTEQYRAQSSSRLAITCESGYSLGNQGSPNAICDGETGKWLPSNFAMCELIQNNFGNCGLGLPGQIYGGKYAAIGEFPWLVRLDIVFDQSRRHFYCDGTLINENWVITTARCVYPTRSSRIAHLTMVMGRNNLPDQSFSSEQLRSAVQIVTHPLYDPAASKNQDFALIKLFTPIVYSAHIRPICLPDDLCANYKAVDYESCPNDRGQVVSVGWQNGPISDFLTKKNLTLYSRGNCHSRAAVNISSSELCAGVDEPEYCSGNSGGPLMCFNNTSAVLLGIASNGPAGCDRFGRPTVFSRICSAFDWIKRTIANFSTSTTLEAKVGNVTMAPASTAFVAVTTSSTTARPTTLAPTSTASKVMQTIALFTTVASSTARPTTPTSTIITTTLSRDILLTTTTLRAKGCRIPELRNGFCRNSKDDEIADSEKLLAINETFTCDCYPGFQNIRGSNEETICEPTCDGEDRYSCLPICSPISTTVAFCQAPPQIPLATCLDCSNQGNNASAQQGDSFIYECASGFEISGNPKITCQRNGEWSRLPTCLPIPTTTRAPDCGSVPDVVNGVCLVESNGDNAEDRNLLGKEATCTCNSGFDLRGSETIACIRRYPDNITWSEIPSCQPVATTPTLQSCNLPEISNGNCSADLASYSVGEIINCTCDDGFKLSNLSMAQLTCQSSESSAEGTWSEVPNCIEHQTAVSERPPACSAIPNVTGRSCRNSGILLPSVGANVGDAVTCSCQNGWTMRGNVRIFCRANGWSGAPGTCSLRATTAAAIRRTTTIRSRITRRSVIG